MKVTEIVIDRSHFEKLSEDERVLLVLLGHIHNEIVTLHKLLVFTLNSHAQTISEVERLMFFGQAQFIGRMYGGKLVEGWEMIERKYFASRLSIILDTRMNESGKSALTELKKYFKKKNLLRDIRNIAFHKPNSDEIKGHLASDKDGIHIVAGEHYANSYYTGFDILVISSVLNTVAQSPYESVQRFLEEIRTNGGHMLDFIGSCASAIVKGIIEDGGVRQNALKISNPPDILEVTLPFFVTNKGKL